MLCQLVCVDRRYQRMNAFNIRELQGILKRKFFTDLVTEHSAHDLLRQTLIGVRFKNNQNLNINPDMSLAYKFGTTSTPKAKNLTFQNIYEYVYDSTTVFSNDKLYFSYVIEQMNNLTLKNLVTTFTYGLNNLVTLFKESLFMIFSQFTSLTSVIYLPINFLTLSYSLVSLNFNFNFYYYYDLVTKFTSSNKNSSVLYESENINESVISNENQTSELSNYIRFTRFNNPLISYDYKCGNYIGS
jgi:hypothetical protein